ncbi:hypothetical protein HMN09_00892400 [Mycena chlorophos]|uniref:Uncharacterized protein n=1 Tax=Mycena chlorophos TaxID=658473 RepID=A0A8H6W1Z8_MYCCL|nr:hypothetical protein HMN09_00892400 [Mycena chlorophos]
MGLHFYTESPIGPLTQKARLLPSLSLLRHRIPFVIFGEDALCIAHFVPTVLFDQHILVLDSKLQEAAAAICADGPYSLSATDTADTWKESPWVQGGGRHAFKLNEDTLLLVPSDAEDAVERIFLHKQSTFHFDTEENASTILNPSPPGPKFRDIRFPSLPAFLDSAVATNTEPPLPVFHSQLGRTLEVWISYLLLYAVPGRGRLRVRVRGGAPELKPAALDFVSRLKDETQPTMIRRMLGMQPLPFEQRVLEWRDLKAERLYARLFVL